MRATALVGITLLAFATASADAAPKRKFVCPSAVVSQPVEVCAGVQAPLASAGKFWDAVANCDQDESCKNAALHARLAARDVERREVLKKEASTEFSHFILRIMSSMMENFANEARRGKYPITDPDAFASALDEMRSVQAKLIKATGIKAQ